MPAEVNWASKYLSSDHHTDRQVRTIVQHEQATGFDFPDPDIHVLCSKHPGRMRKLGLDYEEPIVSHRHLRSVANSAYDQADALYNKSRNRDRQVLGGVSTLLDTGTFASPVVVRRRSHVSAKPPVAPAAIRTVRRPVERTTITQSYLPANSYLLPSLSTNSDFQFDFTPRRSDLYTERGRRDVRAASEPPMTRSADQAIRAAKNQLYKVERELRLPDSAYVYDYEPLAPQERTFISRKSMPIRSVIPGSSALRRGSLPAIRPVVSARAASLPASPSIRRKTRTHKSYDDDILDEDFSFDAADSCRPPPSIGGIRAKANDAKNKMDQHKVLLDRYLPIYLGPENPVPIEVDYRFGELVSRNPALDPFRPATKMQAREPQSDHHKLPPMMPQGLANDLLKIQAKRPTMSKTRKHLRDVLCRAKGDRHYFSDTEY